MAFSFRAGTNWCHDFPKLARESGFYFNMHGSRVRVDWNRISAIDIDRVIRERDFSIIDENINNVIDYCLESEYDIKILDSNFVKLFRLAQLSVEYLLYCKQYLDHSVIILKDELRSKIEQNINMKKEITALEDTVKSLKEKSREKYKLIETRIGGDSNGEIYKCPHCPKTFVSAMFVSAHIARRHSYVPNMHISTSPVHEHYRAETEKLHNEIKTLKERLNQTERIIRNESDKLLDNTEDYIKNTSKNEYLKANRLQEQRRYQEDIGSLKSILFDEIRALREKEHTVNDNILEANVKTLIGQQEKEIESLRNQLLERLTPGIESMQMKLQTQENYWKAKMEDMEIQHHKDIERLTTELKMTQQVADHIKSEYAFKVRDLEKQSMDQSNMLVEQGKQLNSLSRELNNSQIQSNNYRIMEKSIVQTFHESPLLKVKHDNTNSYNSNETYKNLNNIENSNMVIEDIASESSQEYNDKLISITAQNRYTSNKEDTIKDKDTKKFISDLSRAAEHVVIKSSPKNSAMLEISRKKKDKSKYYDVLKDVNETNDHISKASTKALEDISANVIQKYMDSKNVERKRIYHIDNTKNNTKSEFVEKQSSSITESESSSSISQSESDSESITERDDVTVQKYEISPIVKTSSIRKVMSMQEDAQSMLNNRLRDLGIDPDWQGIPTATFKQTMKIIRHQQSIDAKKWVQYNRIKQKILEDVLQKISINNKELGHATLTKKSPLNKLVTHVKSKALKALGNHKDSDEHISVQKTENTTPSKLRLKQKIEILPKKYKDKETFEDTRESPLKRNGTDVYNSLNMASMKSRLIADHRSASRNTSSASSIDSPENMKQMSSMKITVSDSNKRKIDSPISRKQIVAPENNDSDSTTIQQEDSILSPKNNKSVLKPTSASIGSLIKKKVLFDLDDKKDHMTILQDDERKNQVNENNWNISSFSEGREYTLQKEKSMSTGNIVLKTSQSDKIAEISKKIQEQLNLVRKPPIGSVETIFRSNMSLQNSIDNSTGSKLLDSTNLVSSVLGSPVQDFTSPKTKSGILYPQPAPRSFKDKHLTTIQHKNELSTLKYSDLESDIDEILQME